VDTRLKTFRMTEFRGLNKSTNPHNINDAEFVEMTNMELSENRTLQSRKGFVKVIDNISSAIGPARGLYKADWDDYTSTLYSARIWSLTKNDEGAGWEESVGVLPNPTQRPVQFQRWNDKLLMLAQGEPLRWMGSSETISPVSFQQIQLSTYTASTSAGGSLEDTIGYQYNISIIFGSNYRDGEISALPVPGWTIPPYDPKNPPPGPKWLPEYYAQGTTTSANRTISIASATYAGNINGVDISMIKLHRRKCRVIAGGTPAQDTYIGDTNWVQIDAAYIKKENDAYILETEESTNHVITSISGTYDSVNDTATLIIGLTDNGSVDYEAGSIPIDRLSFSIPSAKFMARVNNRLFLGNIVGDDPKDKKTVRYSYIGKLQTPAGLVDEIPNFHYSFPMLIFGAYSWFYCDHEDTDDEITGMYNYRNSLIIFTGKCTFMWQEGMNDPVKISNDVGCIAQQTIREFEGRLIWLSANGIVIYDGNKLKNLTAEKANSYISEMSKDYAWNACSAVFNRRYYITAPFTNTTNNEGVLVYDFDLDEWTHRTYKITDSDTDFYIDCFYKYSNGAKEVLYAGGRDSAEKNFIVKLDDGYADGGAYIDCSIKTKYYDLGAPDIIKCLRAFNIDVTGYAGSITIDLYLDNMNTPAYTKTYTGVSSGFLLNSLTDGRLNVDSIVNISDEMFAFSLPIGKHSSRFQWGVNFTTGASITSIHAIGFDWRAVRKLQRKYGG
jgi:hypothetical protein